MENELSLTPLLEKFGIVPNSPELYRLAFIHRSYNGWAGTKGVDYERLEFLGDSVVNLITAELCYLYHPDMPEGELSKLRSQFICTEAEANYARELGLPPYLITGPSLSAADRNSPHVLEDIFESFLGALYLDQGPKFAMDFVRELLRDRIAKGKVQLELNPKSTLQEAVQGDARGELSYRLISERGEPNHKHFVIGVYLDGTELGRGEGPSKKVAERNAALSALSKMAVS
ncbi:MAG: ribonuclease III [Bacilli bacterium]|nr:ribonuclease III [Bacilli bacterium]MBQ4254844.1 ribonuclease III [Bacilli bacterium]